MYELIPNFFSEDELLALKQIEGKRLEQVLYTVWKNVAKSQEGYQALDWVELYFDDGTRIAFTAGEESDGIHVKEFHFESAQTRILQQFNGQVQLERIDMSATRIWEQAVGQAVTAIGLASNHPNQFDNNILQLEFGNHLTEISLGEEGLVVSA